jgi:sialidase-1
MRAKFLFLIFFPLGTALFFVQQNIIPDNSSKYTKEMVLRLEPTLTNPRNSEGDFIQLLDGNILFIYTHFTGGSGDHSQAFLAGRSSQDHGIHWTTKDKIILPNEATMNIMSVSLLRLKNGDIALFYLRKNSDSDCIPVKRISKDEGLTWSAPLECINQIGYFVMNNDRVIQLSNGRILLPVSLHKTPTTEWSNCGSIICYYSNDSGQTWHHSHTVPNPKNIVLQEPGIVELKDKSLLMLCRTNSGFQYISHSNDMGENWTPVEPSKIVSPMSPASIERIPSTGDLLLIWNNNYEPAKGNGGNRTPLNIAISKDEGKTWENVKTLENNPDGWYCYTAIEFLENSVLLAYCAGNRKTGNGLETTQITRLSVDWIYSTSD